MADSELSIQQSQNLNRPTVRDNQGRITDVIYTFDSTSFSKNWFDPNGGLPDVVEIKSIPEVTSLMYLINPVTVGSEFTTDNANNLRLELDDKYAIHNGHLYEFPKSIDEIITDQQALGYELIYNTSGILTFINPNNLADIDLIKGIGIGLEDLYITFSVTTTEGGFESNTSKFQLIPWENVNIKDNYILQSGGSTGSNSVTGFSITGDTTKTATITLADNSTLVATFVDNDTGGITVTNTNTNLVIHKVAEVNGVNINETVTSLISAVLGVDNILTLTYKDETDTENQITVDLSSLISDNTTVTNVSYNPTTNILTVEQSDNNDFTVNLSEFSINTTVNPDGTVTVRQEGVIKFTISKVGISNDYNDLDNLPDLDFDKYISWKLQVDGDVADDIITQEIVQLLSGTNVSISRVGNNITFNATDTNDNSYVTSAVFDNGTLTINRNDGLPDIVVDGFDSRYLQSVDWTDIQNKPIEFTPEAHTHTKNDITDLGEQDSRLLTIEIPLSETNLTLQSTEQEVKAAVVTWLNTNGFTKDIIDTISWEIYKDSIILISSPQEGESISGDLNYFYSVDLNSINISSPIEGQEISDNLNISYNLE